MSVSIPLKSLSDDLSKMILQHLTLIPINKREEEKRNGGVLVDMLHLQNL